MAWYVNNHSDQPVSATQQKVRRSTSTSNPPIPSHKTRGPFHIMSSTEWYRTLLTRLSRSRLFSDQFRGGLYAHRKESLLVVIANRLHIAINHLISVHQRKVVSFFFQSANDFVTYSSDLEETVPTKKMFFLQCIQGFMRYFVICYNFRFFLERSLENGPKKN